MNFNSGFTLGSFTCTIVLSVVLYLAAIVFAFGTLIPATALANTAAQDEVAPVKTETDFFSGNVVELASDHVTVSRTILGKSPEKRTFRVTVDTRIEGKMKQRSRVTVRYTPSEEGDVALSILVREHADKSDKKK